MGSFSLAHWIIVGIVVLVLFGRGRISETMGEFGKGIKSFKSGMAEEQKQIAKDDSAKSQAANSQDVTRS